MPGQKHLQFVLNGSNNISSVCLTKQFTARLNRPATARGMVPSELVPSLTCGDSTLMVYLGDELKFNGIVWFVEDDGDENTAYTEFLAIDPMVWWRFRPARDADGDFSAPSFLTDFKYGPQIVQAVVKNAVIALNANANPVTGDPATADGPMAIDYSSGHFDSGTVDLSGAPIDYPATLGDVIAMLTDTGAVDVVLTPNVTSGVTASLATLNSYIQYGADRSSSVVLEWQAGSHNTRRAHRSEDMDSIGNALRYYFNPREIDNVQRFRGNITKDDRGGTPNNKAKTDPLAPAFDGELQAAIATSRARYGKYVAWRVYDSNPDFYLNDQKKMYWQLWKTEQGLRLGPRVLVSMTPERGFDPGFDIGDIITVRAGHKLRGGFEAQQRVYEYTVREDRDGPFEFVDIVTSADGS